MKRKSDLGGAMAEFAVVVPVMLLILFGTVQWGFLMLANVSLRNAAEVGARAFILNEDRSFDAAAAAAKAACNSPLKQQLCSASAVEKGTNGVEVTVDYNMDIFFPLAVPGTSGGKFALQAKAVMQ